MAVKGAKAKEIIVNKLLSTFEGSFINDKEVRIPVMEGNDLVQIKVTLTAAKVNVTNSDKEDSGFPTVEQLDLTSKEKQDIEVLASKLGI